jgi:NTP pyrophosphatase (non-canonical NTP hydrolase)
MKKFNSVSDWHKFHSPKNLSMALAAEAAEILEIFQLLSEDESRRLNGVKLEHLKQKTGDCMICMTNLAIHFDLDPVNEAINKISINEHRYTLR